MQGDRGEKIIRLRGDGDAPEGSPCGRHVGLWLSVLTAMGSAAAALVVVGIFVGGLRADLSALSGDWLRDRTALFSQQQMISTTLSQMMATASELKDAVANLRANLAEERQERVDGERRMMQGERPTR